VTGPSPGLFPLGTNLVTYTATDQSGNHASCSSTIQVVDTRAPHVEVKHTVTLRSPDHQYRTVDLADCDIEVHDACGGHLDPTASQASITCVTSDEPDDARGDDDGHTTNDIVIVDSDTVKLRAERDRRGDGRRYQIHFQVRDGSGNRADGVCSVVVPRDGECARHPSAPGCRVHGADVANSVCVP